MLRNFAKKLKVAGAMMATAAALTCAAPAQAALIQGEWDPAYGNPFPNLGWAGTVKFYVPGACLLLSGNINNQNSCANGAMTLQTGHVDLYDLSDPGNILAVLDWTADAAASFITVDISGGAVTGLHADFNQWIQAVPTLAIAGGTTAWFDLWFQGNCAFLSYSADPSNANGGINSDRCSATGGPLMTFTNLDAQFVPEPATLALLLPAAGMLAGFRRRKFTRSA
jgi:hypothetical protein